LSYPDRRPQLPYAGRYPDGSPRTLDANYTEITTATDPRIGSSVVNLQYLQAYLAGGGGGTIYTLANDPLWNAAGDLAVGIGNDQSTVLPLGLNGQVLTIDTSIGPYKLKWATPSGGSSLTPGTVVNAPLVWGGSAWQQTAGTIAFGNADTNLYRSAANTLKTDGTLALPRLSFPYNGAGGDLVFQGDTNLYRNGADQLKTDDSLIVGGQLYPLSYIQSNNQAAGGSVLLASASGDTNNRLQLFNNGTMLWGPGNAAGDVNLYRHGNKWLTSDYPILSQSGGGAVLIAAGANSSILFGASSDTNLYRSAAGQLQTDGVLVVGGRLYVNSTAAFSIQTNGGIILDVSNGGNALYFGSGADTYMYRSAAATVRLINNLVLVGTLDAGGGLSDTTYRPSLQAVGPAPSGNDLNNALNNGWYSISPGYTNAPVSDYGALMVANITYTGANRQIFYRHANTEIYQRYQGGSGTWSAWWKVPSSMQAATVSITTDTGGHATVTFPVAFITAPIVVANLGAGAAPFSVDSITNTNFRINTTASVTIPINYIALVP